MHVEAIPATPFVANALDLDSHPWTRPHRWKKRGSIRQVSRTRR
jgi:predicted nucleic acid-binding protein